MTDLVVSLALVVAIVLFCEAARRAVVRFNPRDYYGIYLLEGVSTFQLCACTHELKLVGEAGRVEPYVGLTLTYVITVIHVSTFRGASCNPNGALEKLYRGNVTAKGAAAFVACQFLAAVFAQFSAASAWTLGLSDLHVRHGKFGFKCFDPISGTLMEAAAVELACAFAIQAVVLHLHKLDEKFRVHAIAAAITSLVYAGGSISGAVFNPALAFSIQFPCSGHTYQEYCFVYWLGPVLGVASCILLFEKIIPFLSGKSIVGLDVPVVQKKKIQ
ncbi:aquaporin-11-like [Polymixia lowei]